jgi:hypothetical protein
MKRASSGALLLALLLAASAPLAPRPAYAQTPEDRETARRLFEDGKSRRDSGDAAGALERFRAADALMNVPTTKLAVARAYLALGKLVEARDAALAVTRLPVASNEPEPFTDARAAAAQLASEIAGRIPSVAIAIRGDAPDSLSIDGENVPREAWSEPRRVNPGKHAVVAKLGAGEVTQDFTVAEGGSASITLDTRALHARSAAAAPRPALITASASSRPLGTLFWIGAGVSAAGLATGAIAGGISLSNKSSADSFCRNDMCPPAAYSSLDAASTWATVSTAGFVVAGAGAVLAIVALVLRPPAADATRPAAALLVRPGGAGLMGSF